MLRFSRGIRILSNDVDILQFFKDVTGYELVDFYVEHNIDDLEVVDESELGRNVDDDDDVQCSGFRSSNVDDDK